jgi:Flp pilus assembly protein TadD
MLWAILRRLSIPGALLAAFVFVLHPVNVESVAWIAQRKNTLSMVFFLLSVIWYLKADTSPGVKSTRRPEGQALVVRSERHGSSGEKSGRRPNDERQRRTTSASAGRRASAPDDERQRWYWLSFAAFLLAMLSKGSVAILPGVLLLLIWWRRGALTRTDVVKTLPFFVLAAGLTLLNIWFQMHYMTGAIRHVTPVQRALGAGAIVWFYLFKAVIPVRLMFMYPQWDVQPADVRWWAPLAAAAAVTVLLLRYHRRPGFRGLLFTWMYFGLALVPVMGLTDVYFMKYALVADHYQYIAIVGVAACLGAGLAVLNGYRPLVARVAGGALLAILALASWQQARLYADAETLYRRTLADNPSSWLVHNDLGVLLVGRGSFDEAIPHFRESVRLHPDQIEAHNNLCHVASRVGRMTEAITECAEALRIDPNLPTAHNDLGAALVSLGRSGPARAEFEEALKLDGSYAEAHNNLANILIASGQYVEAIDHYRSALRVTPDFAAAHLNLGFALERQGRVNEAVAQYEDALRLDPTMEQARNRLGVLSRHDK